MSRPGGPVTVRVPATSANLGPGFDSLGLALSLHDVVRAQVAGRGLDIEVSGAGADTAALDEQHLVVRAMRAAFDALGRPQPPGIRLRCVNAIPQGYGLGSSAGAIVAGLLAARALAESDRSPGGGPAGGGPAGGSSQADGDGGALAGDALLQLAARLEGHPDNVAACLHGGLTIAWTQAPAGTAPAGGVPAGTAPAGVPAPATGEEDGMPAAATRRSAVRSARLEPLPRLAPVVCVPPSPLSTAVARQALPREVPYADAAANSARTALLIAALAGQPDLLLDATEDFLHQAYRASAMPATASLVGRLRSAGIPAVVSGAGPTVLALTVAGQYPGPDAVAPVAAATDTPWRVRPLAVDRHGAVTERR